MTDKRKNDPDRRRGWTKRARNDRRASQNKNWLLPMYVAEGRSGDERREGIKKPAERLKKLPLLPKIFKVRTIYLKVDNMEKSREFYMEFLGIEPKRDGNVWCEFPMGNINFGLLLSKDNKAGNNFVPVFEFADNEIYSYIGKAKELGAKIIHDGLGEPQSQSVLMKDPFGNEFEVSRIHD